MPVSEGYKNMCEASQVINENLKVFILKRFREEEEDNWSKGMDLVIAHNEVEAKDLAIRHYPVKEDEYKEIEIIVLDVAKFVCGYFYERTVIH